MFIETEGTPNPATLKFLPGRDVMGATTADFASADAAARSPLATDLFALPGVVRVFLGADFITVTKSDATDWQRLKPALSEGNLAKTMKAPVTAIVAFDPHFYDHLPKLFPHTDAKAWFTSSPALAEETAFRNGTLQGAYLILAARAMGLATGAMSGFDKAKVDAAFLSDRGWKSNFLVNIGHGSTEGMFPRSPRFAFDEACVLL